MPKLPEKIDDWTPPWEKHGEDFDEQKAATLIFSSLKAAERAAEEKKVVVQEKKALETENVQLKAQVAAKPAEEGKDAKISELTTEIQALKAEGRPEDRAKIEKYEVALEVGGLNLRDAQRLVGDDRDALLEDAADLAERLGSKKDDGEGEGGNPPPSQRPEPRSLGNGRQRQGEQPRVRSVEEILADDAKDPSSTGFAGGGELVRMQSVPM